MQGSGPISKISADKLMIHQSALMTSLWGDTKQSDWGLLTYCSILLGAHYLQNNHFKSLKELYFFLAKCRELIAAILDQDKDLGSVRKYGLTTIVYDHQDCYLRDQLLEVQSHFDYLLSSYGQQVTPEESHISKQAKPLVKIDIEKLDSSTKQKIYPTTFFGYSRTTSAPYIRNRIEKAPLGFEIDHPPQSSVAIELNEAEHVFTQLLMHPNLSPQEKGNYLKEILFYYGDATPLVRGSAATTQIMYHVLEKVFLKKFTYFGNASSQYGNPRGLQYDMVAMLSPDFSFFLQYLSTHILTPEIEVVEPDLAQLLKQANITSSSDLPNLAVRLRQMKEKLEIYEKNLMLHLPVNLKRTAQEVKEDTLYLYDSEYIVIAKRIAYCFRYYKQLEFLSQFLTSTDPNIQSMAELLFEKLITTMSKNLLFYPHFYQTLGTPLPWLKKTEPRPITQMDSLSDFMSAYNIVLNHFQQTIKYWQALAHSTHGEFSEDIALRDSTFAVRELLQAPKAMSSVRLHQMEPMSNLLYCLQHYGRNPEFQYNFKLYIDFLKRMDQIKNASSPLTPEKIDAILKNFSEEAAQTVLLNFDRIKENLIKIYPVLKIIYPNIPPLTEIFAEPGIQPEESKSPLIFTDREPKTREANLQLTEDAPLPKESLEAKTSPQNADEITTRKKGK